MIDRLRRVAASRFRVGKLRDRLFDRGSSEDERIHEASAYWTDTSDVGVRANAHWDDVGPFEVHGTWAAIGERHLDFFDRMSGIPDHADLGTVVDWGCGGGANVVAFGARASCVFGVDVASETLEEASQRAAAAGLRHFSPILADIAAPEACLDRLPSDADLFLCTYVFELVPTKSYGSRLLDIAHHVLRPGGMAFIQIKYDDGHTRRPRGRYRDLVANATSYGIEEFWMLARGRGFEPDLVKLLPIDELVDDRRYAYFLLVKSEDAPAG